MGINRGSYEELAEKLTLQNNELRKQVEDLKSIVELKNKTLNRYKKAYSETTENMDNLRLALSKHSKETR